MSKVKTVARVVVHTAVAVHVAAVMFHAMDPSGKVARGAQVPDAVFMPANPVTMTVDPPVPPVTVSVRA